ncbi:MAG: hypothetical protein APR53_10955 [Methanoculleus sp. SDB]|nr:MAG: hypothetical protein APR53_10955 [Methanoculleus sp. SDB]
MKDFNPDWVDANIPWLKSKIGILEPFDPSSEFYKRLGTAVSSTEFAEACSPLFRHVGRPALTIEFGGLFGDTPGMYSCGILSNGALINRTIKISANYLHIRDSVARGRTIGAIVAHELTHDVLFSKGIQREHDANETLTDLASIALGLGKLILNGRVTEMDNKIWHLGYLSEIDMVYAYSNVNTRTGIPADRQMRLLTEHAKKTVIDRLRDIENHRIREMRDPALDTMNELLEECSRLAEKHGDLVNRYAIIRERQDQLNATHAFWEISSEDNQVFSALTLDIHFNKTEKSLAEIPGVLLSIRKECDAGTARLRASRITEEIVKSEKANAVVCEANLASVERRLAEFAQHLSVFEATQERYFGRLESFTALLNICETDISAVISARSALATRFAAFTRLPDIRKNIRSLGPTIEEISGYLVDLNSQSEEKCIRDCIQRLQALLTTKPVDFQRISRAYPSVSDLDLFIADTRKRINRLASYGSRYTVDFTRVEEPYLSLLDGIILGCEELVTVTDGITAMCNQIISNQQRIEAGHASLRIQPEDGEIIQETIRAIRTREVEDQLYLLRRDISGLCRRVKALRAEITQPETGSGFDADDGTAEFTNALESIKSRAAALDATVRSRLAVQERYISLLEASRLGRFIRGLFTALV